MHKSVSWPVNDKQCVSGVCGFDSGTELYINTLCVCVCVSEQQDSGQGLFGLDAQLSHEDFY